MTVMLPTLAVAFTAFCVWLTVRIVNRRERWAKRMLAAVVGVPVLYVASFGPVCRLANRQTISTASIRFAYKPILKLLHEGPEPVQCTLGWYAGFSRDRISYLELDLECVIRL